MPVSPRKTRSATSALRNRTTSAPAARPAKKGRVVSTSNAKMDIPPVQRLQNLLTDALTTAKTLEVTPDNRTALQNVREMAVSLLDILPAGRAVRDLKYDLHYISLTSLSRELAKVERYDPDDRHDEHGPLMGRIMEEVVEWLPDIWLAMTEENSDMDLIRRCMIICSSAADNLGEEFDCSKRLVVTNSENTTVYNHEACYVLDYMAWMWREFLVFSDIRGSPVSAGKIINDDDLFEQVFSLFRRDTSDAKNEDGYAFWDDHWTQEMKNVASRLYAERHNHRIAEFIMYPSFRQYTSLVSKYPVIKPSILSLMGEQVFSDKPFIPCPDAAKIFAAASQTEDIVRLLDRLTEKESTLHTQAILIIIKYLSKVSDKKYRTRVLQVVEDGLKKSKRDALDAVNDLFPGLADAQLWLRRLRDAGDFPFDDDILHDKYHERDENLRSFAERAVIGGPLTDPDWAPPVKKPETQREAYDCCFEEEPESSECDLAQSIQDWTPVLGKWPDEKAAAKVWSRIKFDGSELMFSAVEGAEEALLYHLEHADLVQQEKWYKANPLPPPPPQPRVKPQCRPRFACFPSPHFRSYDYNKSPSSVYGYVTDGLQALIKTFSCQDHRSLCK